MANLARSALGATATASSVTGGPTENNPANAIDDNGGTYVLVPHGSNPGSSWLQVDLQTQQYVAGFRLTFVNSVWTPGQYRIESSQDGVVWASRYYRADTASTGADTGQINLFQPATCRYWRVRQLSIPGGTTGMGPLAFELHNVADGADPGDDPEDVAPGGWTMGGTNHALTSAGASATSNRSNHQGTVPDNAIDGNAGTYYLAVKSTDDTWIRVDLGQARGIAGWAISWVNSSWYAAGYVIEYSTDDSEWTVVHTASGQTDAGVPATAFAGGGGATARYWRIRSSNMPGEGMGPTTFALCEGTPPGEPPPPAPKWVNTVSKYHNFESETVTYSLPDEVQDGDLLVFAIATQPAVSYYDMHNATAVAQGWTRLFVDGAGHALLALYKVWHTGDATSLSFTGYGYPLYGHTALTIFRRVHQTEPLAGWTRNEYTTGNPASTTAFDPADWSGDADALLAVLWATAGSRPRTMTTPPADTILHAQHNSATFGSLQVTTKLHSDKADAPAQTATFSAAQEAHQLAVLVRPQDNAGVTHEAAASVSAVATPDAELVQGTIGEAALEAVATVAADGVREKPGEAAAEAAATASAVGSITLGGISDLTEATAEITEANGIVGIGGKANVDAIVVATMNGGYELWADAAPEALAEAEADLLAALAGEADLAATATTSEPVGYMSVAGAADRNAFAVVVALASLVLNGAAEAEALAAFDPEPEASVTKPGAAWRFAVASAFGFGGKVLIGQKTLVARAEVQASGFTGPGGEAAVTASATIDNALPVLADVGAT
ncbi:MAG: discoidin domain-containing protein, partial [Vicinamibacterales bacterium]